MPPSQQQVHKTIHTVIKCFIVLIVFKNAKATEVTESSWILDNSLEFEINLPTLTCRTKYTEYKEVQWYKDYVLLKKGGAGFSDHVLTLVNLLGDSSLQLDNPLKLQGYYWCETDYANASIVHRYLFRIKEVDTYAGKLVSTHDSLGDSISLTTKEKIAMKKSIYEEEMQQFLFGFLPKPNTYVTDITVRSNGLEVYFYVYDRQLFHPRQPADNELVKDQNELHYILEYLNNETVVDDIHYRQILEWTEFRGINIKDIALYSTLGCYQETSLVPGEPPKEVTWPYADIGEVVISDESCSTKGGLAVTRLCTGSFYIGAHWGNPSGICNMPPSELTLKLKSLYNKFGDDPKPAYIRNLQKLTEDPTELTVTDLHIIVDILTELSEVRELTSEEIDEAFTVIDRIPETNKSELVVAKSTIKLTRRLLEIIDNVLSLASVTNKEVLVTKQHLLLDTQDTKVDSDVEDHIIGIAVLAPKHPDTLENSTIQFLTSNSAIPKHESLAYFLLPPDLVIKREKETAPEFESHINIVFFKDWLLFPKPLEVLFKRHYRVLPTPVMYVSVSGGPAWNLTSPAHLYFKDTQKRKIENPVCVHFDPRDPQHDGGWGTEGCEYGGLKDGFYICRCHHLSIFAVILSEKHDISAQRFKLGTAIYVSCAVSIIALSITVLLYLLSKVWRSTVDHSVLFGLALSLLCCLILLFISEMKFLWKPGCLVMGMLIHYTILVMFGWLLVQALMNRLRFANKTDINEVPHFILKSALSCWCVPIVIMIIIWLTKFYKYYEQETCRKTMSDVSSAALIPIVIVLFVTLCINVCAIYAISCRFKKDFLIGNSIYNESVVKFRIALTIFLFFVLTWIFGFFALQKASKQLRVLFSISITLTSYYVTLFFIFHEVSLWELCRNWKRNKEPEAKVVRYVAEQKVED